MITLAQVSRTLPGTHAAEHPGPLLPAPKSKEQAVAYAVGGVLLLLAIFALVIWLKRRDA